MIEQFKRLGDIIVDALQGFFPEKPPTAVEALGKTAMQLGLNEHDLVKMARTHYMLQALGIERKQGDTAWSWGRRHGFITDADASAALSVDILGMGLD